MKKTMELSIMRFVVTTAMGITTTLLLFMGTSSAVVTPCTFCANDDAPVAPTNGSEPAQVQGGFTCDELVSGGFFEKTEAASEGCYELQVLTYRYCGCPGIPSNYCHMCPGAAHDIPSPNKRIPDLTNGEDDVYAAIEGKTCDEALFLPLYDLPGGGLEECSLLSNAAGHCGCPNATERSCFLCGGGDEGADQSILHPERLLPPSYDYDCQQLSDRTRFSDAADSTCDDQTSGIPADVEMYCGCPAYAAPANASSTCDLCGGWNDANATANATAPSLINSDRVVAVSDSAVMSCGTLYDVVAPSVTSESYCESLRRDFPMCCEGYEGDDEPTPEPSPSGPTAPTTASSMSNIVTDAPASEPDQQDELRSSSYSVFRPRLHFPSVARYSSLLGLCALLLR